MPQELALAEAIDSLEAAHVGASGNVCGALRAKLAEAQRMDDTIRVRFPLDGSLDEALVRAMLARHGLAAFRERGQKRTSLMTRGPEGYLHSVFLPILREARRLFLERLRSEAADLLRGVLPPGITVCPECLHPRAEGGHDHADEDAEEEAEAAAFAGALAHAIEADKARIGPPAQPPPAPSVPRHASAPSAPIAAMPAPGAASASVSRNAPCPCGSGRKYKRCCGRGE